MTPEHFDIPFLPAIAHSKGWYQFQGRNTPMRLEDCCLAVARLRRWTGWSTVTVAAHSLNVGRYVRHLGGTEQEIRTGYGHDLHECVIGDVTRPLRKALRVDWSSALDSIEAQAEHQFAEWFGWEYPHPEIVQRADAMILAFEARETFGVNPPIWGLPPVDATFDWHTMDGINDTEVAVLLAGAIESAAP
ncbi:MAG: hypothetical protein GX879_11795 [Bacteroidales bacterium]|nr:hypothetical protein [Bacteroidales bacterium]